MGQIIGFKDLKVGQRIKIKGQMANEGKLTAVEINVKPDDPEMCIESKLQAVELERNSLRLLNRDFVIGGSAIIKNLPRQVVALKDLKVGDVVKMKGTYSAARGFVAEKIKVQEPRGFRIDELQGAIDKIDREANTIEVLGFTIGVNEKTEIEGI